MKKLFFLILLPLMITKGQNILPDLSIADSLKAGTDTTNIHNIGYGLFGYGLGEWWISAKDTGTTYTDSVSVFSGTVRRNKRTGAAIDTLWKRITFKDTAWNVSNVITKAASETEWIPLRNMPELIKFVLSNAEFVSGRTWYYVIEAKRIQ